MNSLLNHDQKRERKAKTINRRIKSNVFCFFLCFPGNKNNYAYKTISVNAIFTLSRIKKTDKVFHWKI